MAVQTILLPRGVWCYDPLKPLGREGGFGRVYEGYADGHGNIAVKRLHLRANDAAHREMRIANEFTGKAYHHVLGVLDAGEDAATGTYFVVMPKAERSLQEVIDRGTHFGDEDAAKVLLEIIEGLLEVPDIVHRDLKPDNIMLHDGHWKIADFGIARFVEESTSLQTLKGCLSPHYAAPEQWQYVRATGATDVYALGCIAYALLTGNPPFLGTMDELQHKHRFADPPPLSCAPKLRSLCSMLLRKIPASRPSQQRVRTVLSEFLQAPVDRGRFEALAQAGARVAHAQSDAERSAETERQHARDRKNLAASGADILREIIKRIFARIEQEMLVARKGKPYNDAPYITVGDAVLTFPLPAGRGYLSDEFTPISQEAFAQAGWDILAGEWVVVEQQQPKYRWSASLWYARLPGTQDYRWYEVSYFAPLRADAMAPYALDEIRDAALAAAPVMHVYQTAFGPVPIDDENEEDFTERWGTILARAAEGKLRHPTNLPLQPQFWKQQLLE